MEYSPIQIGEADGITDGLSDSVSNITPTHLLDSPSNQTPSVSSCLESNHGQESVISDSESCSSGACYGQFQEFDGGLIRLFEGDRGHDLIKRRFLSSLGLLGTQTKVVAIHRNPFSGVMGQARMQSFQIFAKAIEKKCGGNANVKYAWYGGSNDIGQIVSHGFGPQMIDNYGLYGRGVYLSPDHSPLECVKNLSVGKYGVRHLLLCRVILGKAEVVHPGSQQIYPSSDEFDTGVDNLSAPKKYIVWSSQLNTHILPEFVISFIAPPSLKGFFRTRESLRKPTSPWMPFPALISSLSKLLPPTIVALIAKHYGDYGDKKISREELIRRLRKIAGDKLLIAVIKSFANKATSGSKQATVQNGVENMDCCETAGNMDELIMYG